MKTDLKTLLQQWREGDRSAGEQVIALVYSDLRKLAAYFLNSERPDHTLQPTDLVNEAFVRLTSGKPVDWQNRAHFIAVAARQMRRILIDHARRQKALKRNDTMIPLPFSEGPAARKSHLESVLAMDEILKELENLDTRSAQIVELRVFGGLTEKEMGEVMGISVATVKRDWTFARAWLIRRLRGEDAEKPGGPPAIQTGN
jgi:RNA polymerase sigma factor (TIGR02999 family)